MKQYNAMTIFRMTGREYLSEFFKRSGCLQFIDFHREKLYEIGAAFSMLPETQLSRIETQLRAIFMIASNDTLLLRLADEIKSAGFADLFSEMKNRYDMAFHIFLNYPEIWRKAADFCDADMLPKRHWTRCPDLPPGIVPDTSAEALDRLGKRISAYLWEKQIRGKRFITEYRRRTDALHYFFVYLSDYAANYEAWNEDGLETRSEKRVISIVFAYDSELNALDIFNFGGCRLAAELQKIFCSEILKISLTGSELLKSAFKIDMLKYRSNMPAPDPQEGVLGAKIVSMNFTYTLANRRRAHKISVDGDGEPDEIYSVIETDFANRSIPLGAICLKSVKISLVISESGKTRKMNIELTSNSCTLKSNAEELRRIGEKYIRFCGIDPQPLLCGEGAL